MNTIPRLITLFAAASLVAATLAGCTASGASVSSGSTTAASTAPTPSPTPETPCAAAANPSGVADTGPREFANGEVTVDENGYPVEYTVATGDASAAVIERLCINQSILAGLNQSQCPWYIAEMHPGDVWNLDPQDPRATRSSDDNPDC